MMKPRCPEKSVVNRFQSRSGLAFLDLPLKEVLAKIPAIVESLTDSDNDLQ